MADAEHLCLSCGMCCDGTLFDLVGLYPDEPPTMTRLGLPIVVRGDDAYMPQPCAALDGLACRVYAERPRRCTRYFCHLLVALNVGEVSLDEAQKTVALAKELVGVQREQFLDFHFRGRSHRRRTSRSMPGDSTGPTGEI